jgi:acetyl esterase/lipase
MSSRSLLAATALICATLVTSSADAQQREPDSAAAVPEGVTLIDDVRFASVDGRDLLFDLYMPADVVAPPLLVWVHGGGWSRGTHNRVSTFAFVEAGYALASVEYRLSGVAPFPAQIHDIKGAIRFLRAQAGAYGYDTERIGILGVSAGAHLAILAATTNGDSELEGAIGGNLDQSSDVVAVVSYFGASNLTTILAQSTPFGLNVRVPALTGLYGGPPDERTDLARLASPVFHVDASDPPLLLLHGDQDPQMPINQSHEIHSAYKDLGLDVHFEVVHGAGHGGGAFFDAERTALVRAFLDRTLRNYVSDARRP